MKTTVILAVLLCLRAPAQTPSNGITNPGAQSGPPIGIVQAPRAGAAAVSLSGFISGRVAMEDGSPVPHVTRIERVCSTSAQTVAHVDGEGRFSFQTGIQTDPEATASETGARSSSGMIGIVPMSPALGTAPIQHCELRASLSGFRSDTLDLTNRRPTDHPDVGVLVLHRIEGGSGGVVSAGALAIPRAARKAYQAKDYDRAVRLWPAYTEAWIQLGIAAGRKQAWEDCARDLAEGLRLDPNSYPQAWYVDAMANYYLRNYERAEKSAREAMRLDPDRRNPRAGYVLGMIRAQLKDYGAAAAELRSFLQAAPNAPDAAQVRAQLTEIENFRDIIESQSAAGGARK